MTSQIQALPGQFQQIQKMDDPREKQEEYARFIKTLNAILDEERKTIIKQKEILEDQPFKYVLWYWMFFGKILSKYKEFMAVDSVKWFLKSCQNQFQLEAYELERFIEKSNTSCIHKYLFLVMKYFDDKNALFQEITQTMEINHLLNDLRNIDYEIRVATLKLTNNGESQFLLLKSREIFGYKIVEPVQLEEFQNTAIENFIEFKEKSAYTKLNQMKVSLNKTDSNESQSAHLYLENKPKKVKDRKPLLKPNQVDQFVKEIFDFINIRQKLNYIPDGSFSATFESEEIKILFRLGEKSTDKYSFKDVQIKWENYLSLRDNKLLLRGLIYLWIEKGRIHNKAYLVEYLLDITPNIGYSKETLLKDTKDTVIFNVIESSKDLIPLKEAYNKFKKGNIQIKLEKLISELLKKL